MKKVELFKLNTLLGIIASILMIVGAFIPLVKIHGLGELSYMAYGIAGDGVFLILGGIITFIFALYFPKENYFTALFVLMLMVQLFIGIQNDLADVNEGYLGGWFVIGTGILLSYISAYITKIEENQKI